MGSRVKPRTLESIHSGVGPKVFTVQERNSAGARLRGPRRKSSTGANPTRKPLSAGAVRQDPQRPDPLINGHGANTDTCDSSEDAGPIFTNVPSAWEAESSASRPGTGASARPETRNISPQDILSASMEQDYNLVYEIDVHGSHIGKLRHLDKFTRVRVLDASCNHISVIENLHCNVDLRELKLYDNQIKDIQNLQALKELCHLQLQNNKIRSIAKGLAGLRKLKVLRLDGNQLLKLDVRELAPCSQLTSLNLSSNCLDSLQAVSCLPNLEELYGANNRLRSIGDLSRCKKLQEVDLTNNRLTDISGLKGLPHLRILHLSKNALTSLKSAGVMKCLEELFVSHNRLSELSSLAKQCPNLQIIDVSENCIEDWEQLVTLCGLSELVELSVAGNPCCSEGSPAALSTSRLHKKIPKLEWLDGIQLKRPASRRDSTPLMRPMSASTVVSSRQVENQIKSIESDVANFELELSKRFESLRSTMKSLPTEDSSTSVTGISSAPSSARPMSRCGKRSRIHAAKMFADSNF